MNEQNLSQWFDLAEQKPWEVGVYELSGQNFNGTAYSYWNGNQFMYTWDSSFGKQSAWDSRHDHSQPSWFCNMQKWRGLSTNPEVKKISGNRKVTRYVVTILEEVVATYESKPNAYKHANRHPSGRVKTIRFRTPE